MKEVRRQDYLSALVTAERTTPHRSEQFDKFVAAIETVASTDGTFDAARVRAHVEANVPELVHYNSGCVYRWLLATKRATVIGWAKLNNVEHGKVNTLAPVYRLAVA